jgi:anti-sigma factor RsiW
MISERTEFLISQYVDGTIADEDRPALEAELAADPDARLLVHEYRKLNTLLASQPLPEIDFAALTTRIGEAIDDRNAAPPYRLPFAWRKVGPALAIAACAVIAVGLWLRPTTSQDTAPTVAATDAPAVVQVAVLRPADAQLEFGPALQRIRVGPPVDQPYSRALSEALVTRPNTLFIAKADRPAQDTPQSLY